MRRTIIKLGIGAILCMAFFIVASTPSAEAWYDDDYRFRAEITIDDPFPDNYQIRVVLDNGTGNVDNFSTVIFVDNENSGLLPFWLENENNNTTSSLLSTCTYHVLIPENDDPTFYTYYSPLTDTVDNSDVVGTWGYDAGFDSSSNWTEVDKDEFDAPAAHLTISTSNSRIEFTNFAPHDNGYIFTDDFSTSITDEWTIDFTIRVTNLNNYSPAIGAGFYENRVVGHTDQHSGSFIWVDTTIKAMTSDGTGYDFGANGGNVGANFTYYGRITRVNSENIESKVWFNHDRSGSPDITAAIGNLGLLDQEARVLFGISAWNTAGGNSESTGWVDSVMFRKYINQEPGITVGSEDAAANQPEISTPTANNILIDRDQDNAITSPILTTTISVQVTHADGVAALADNDIWLSIFDNDSGLVLENQSPVSSVIDNDNAKTFTYAAYNPDDVTVDNTDLGSFWVSIYGIDNGGHADNSGLDNIFTVDDIYDLVINSENLIHHGHRIWSDAFDSHGGTIVTITQGWRADNNDGTVEATVLDADDIENTYYPTAAGSVFLIAQTAELDGVSVTLNYQYPNFEPGIVSITIDNAIIDNHASDNAITATRIEVVFEDNDNLDDFVDNFYIALRGHDAAVIDNRLLSSEVTLENENFAVLVIIYDAEDNVLAPTALGGWSVWASANDNWGFWEGWTDNVFIVNEAYATINGTPTNPFAGFDFTVSGDATFGFGTGTAAEIIIIDAVEGTFAQGAGNAYSENYYILTSAPGAVVSITVSVYDGVLDGENTTSYTVSDNQIFQISVRFEENYGLVDWIHDENRPITIEFSWGGGTVDYTLSSNPENFIIPSGDNVVRLIQLTDNGLYWRRNVIDVYGGDIAMIIAGDYGTVGGTAIGDVDDFTFVLNDLSGLYDPPEGIMSFRLWIGDNLAIINEDFWGADWKLIAWLVNQTRYQVWMISDGVPLRLIGPIDAVNSVDEKVISVVPIISEILEIYDDVYWAASRVSDNVIRVEYQDNLSQTTFAYVEIQNYAGTLIQAYQPDNEWFIIMYSLANPNDSYFVYAVFNHTTYGEFVFTVPIAAAAPPGTGGLSNRFGLPDGVTLASLGSFIIMMVIALAFDSTRLPFGMLAMAIIPIFCWRMGWLDLPGPYAGAYTATIFVVAAVIVILTWRSRR